MNNAAEVRKLKDEYGITSKWIADKLHVSLVTVTAWLRNEQSINYRPMPDGRLRHLKLELRGKTKKVKL